MRLSALVKQNGIDPFTADDILFVSKHASKAPEGLILVGGQAIETWGIFFNNLAPTGDVQRAAASAAPSYPAVA